MFEFKDDCIHLKACRRLQKIARTGGNIFGRGCTDACTAYIPGDIGNYVSADEAVSYARQGASSIENGYDAYDTYCEADLAGKSIGDIVSEYYEEKE